MPSTRATLLAPMLPLPCSRMSTPRRFAMITPNGIDPANESATRTSAFTIKCSYCGAAHQR